MKRLALISILLIIVSVSGSAQRTSNRQFVMSLQSGYPVGGRLDVGQYLMKSYWNAYAGATLQSENLSSGDDLKYMPVRMGGRFMCRLAATRSRSFSLYAGGGAFVGIELVDYNNSLPPTVDLGLAKKNAFIFGITANVELEWYVGRKLAIIAGANAPLTFLSNIARLKNGAMANDNSSNNSVLFNAEGLLGLRITLN